jgi:hypothetical protein
MDNLKKKSFEVPTLTRLALTLPLTQAVSHASLKASCILKLRDHPLMTRKSGFKNWPPAWTTRRLDESTKPTDEIGILEMPLRPQRFTNRLFLFIVHGGFRYIASMAFDDPAFRDELYRLLKSNIGRSIKEIGDIELSYSLSASLTKTQTEGKETVHVS